MNQSISEKLLAVGKRLADQAIHYAAGIPGRVSGEIREDEAVAYVLERVRGEVEARDHLIPFLAGFMDLPVVDAMQRDAEVIIVRAWIRRMYAAAQLRRMGGV